MTTEDEQKENADEATALETTGAEGNAASESALAGASGDAEAEAALAPSELGVERYVHAAFFVVGLLTAYLAGKVLLSGWNMLADWPPAVRSLPALLAFSEEDRGNLTLVIGAVLGVLLVLRYYRRPAVRSWATDVAGELSKVTWPSREMVTNGTLIVLIAGAIATVYVTLLDRFWGYLTNLVYGA